MTEKEHMNAIDQIEALPGKPWYDEPKHLHLDSIVRPSDKAVAKAVRLLQRRYVFPYRIGMPDDELLAVYPYTDGGVRLEWQFQGTIGDKPHQFGSLGEVTIHNDGWFELFVNDTGSGVWPVGPEVFDMYPQDLRHEPKLVHLLTGPTWELEKLDPVACDRAWNYVRARSTAPYDIGEPKASARYIAGGGIIFEWVPDAKNDGPEHTVEFDDRGGITLFLREHDPEWLKA